MNFDELCSYNMLQHFSFWELIFQHFSVLLFRSQKGEASNQKNPTKLPALQALPKGDLEGPASPLPIRDAIGSCMGAALNELEGLVEKVLAQPQLLQKRELWKRQGSLPEGNKTHTVGICHKLEV